MAEQPADSVENTAGARPLLVLVNALALRLGGGGTYIVEQLAALSVQPALEISVLASKDTAARIREACGPTVRVYAVPDRGLVSRVLHEQLLLPFRARAHDVVYMPGGFAMFASPRPQAVTNHNPHHFPASARAFWRARYPRRLRYQLAIEWRLAHASVGRAEAFLTVSDAFRAAVEDDMGPRDNILLLRSAAPDMSVLPAVREREELDGEPYILTVAHDYFHKDWDGLIRAFREHTDLPRLVIVGGWRNDHRRVELERLLESDGNAVRVTLLGRLADRQRIAGLYRGASCFIAHSFLEAGPLTPGEAVRFGLRLVASDIPPHREVGGPDALFYDPRDLDGLAAAVRSAVAAGPRTRREACSERQWTWADNAATLAHILRSVARDDTRGTR